MVPYQCLRAQTHRKPNFETPPKRSKVWNFEQSEIEFPNIRTHLFFAFAHIFFISTSHKIYEMQNFIPTDFHCLHTFFQFWQVLPSRQVPYHCLPFLGSRQIIKARVATRVPPLLLFIYLWGSLAFDSQMSNNKDKS